MVAGRLPGRMEAVMMDEQTKTETTEQIPVYPEDEHKYSGLLEED